MFLWFFYFFFILVSLWTLKLEDNPQEVADMAKFVPMHQN